MIHLRAVWSRGGGGDIIGTPLSPILQTKQNFKLPSSMFPSSFYSTSLLLCTAKLLWKIAYIFSLFSPSTQYNLFKWTYSCQGHELYIATFKVHFCNPHFTHPLGSTEHSSYILLLDTTPLRFWSPVFLLFFFTLAVSFSFLCWLLFHYFISKCWISPGWSSGALLIISLQVSRLSYPFSLLKICWPHPKSYS